MGSGGEESQGLAPVIPIFGRSEVPETGAGMDSAPSDADRLPEEPGPRHPARNVQSSPSEEESEQPTAPRLRALRSHGSSSDEDVTGDPAELRRTAEEVLVRKLRARALSISEARSVLKGLSLDSGAIDEVIEEFCRRGYLDDALLAEHLVTAGVERKGQGRVALSRALAQRGLSRDAIDAALSELPDDDAERALEFARTKARSMSRLDFDTALRRLVGQLSRRGYAGGVAMTAARTALNEASSSGAGGGVRFVDSE